MSTNSQKNHEEEIDLSAISQKVQGFFRSLNDSLFNLIQFVIKNSIVIVILFVLGVGIGMYLDKTSKTYDHQIVVRPNFGSFDYLYAKVALIDSKIKERDTVFLKSIGIQEPSKLTKIEIKPIIDIYQFINNSSDRNFELLRLMSEDTDIKKILEDTPTAKNYFYHLISFKTKHVTTNKKTIEPLMKYLNSSVFYTKIQKEAINNLQISMKANDVILSQIDNFLNGFSNGDPNAKSEKLVYYNENSPLNDIIESKERLVRDQGNNRINLVSMDKVIKEISQITNIENTEAVNGKLKLVLPILFIAIYILIGAFIRFYKNQKAKRTQTAA